MRKYLPVLSFAIFISGIHAQVTTRAITSTSDLFSTHSSFIKNIGQYGQTYPGLASMGTIQFGYEGFNMPALFTSTGIILLQRQLETSKREEREKTRGKKKKENEDEQAFVDKKITLTWRNANVAARIEYVQQQPVYHVYGTFSEKAYGYQKVIVHDLYPNVDVEYSFTGQHKAGFEYRLILHPGADLSQVRLEAGGDVTATQLNDDGTFLFRSAIGDVTQSAPIAFLENESSPVSIVTKKKNNTISFDIPSGYDQSKTLVIDPFISTTNSLTGSFNNKLAKDIDFDYEGNVYVSGGGDQAYQKLAKYNSAGVLLWTFSGTLTAPVWQFGNDYGGWVVEKTTGAIYMGQGLTGVGFTVVRLNTDGLYDGFATTPNTNFGENWKMLYSCRNGVGTILVAGGGGSANNELALIAPPSVNPTPTNISGLSGGHNDISDIIMDPLTNDMYTIFSVSVLTPSTDAKIYKHTAPYTPASISWSVPTGLFALKEPQNRPYMQGIDNSSNTIAINSNYLFYWDGKTLKAFNKSDGSVAGTPFTVSTSVPLMQGGIFADECNNVYIGQQGKIAVYKFTGTVFDDLTIADISITGFNTNVYDLAYDNGKKLLYASGDGFVGSFDISSYCPSTTYQVDVSINCAGLSAVATIRPTPPVGTSLIYVLYDGATVVASNTTGIFSGLTSGTNYTIKAYLNQACGGTQATHDFVVTGVPVLQVHTPPAACLPSTTDLTAASITAGSDGGLVFTYWQDAGATVALATPTSVGPGTYYIKAVALSGCSIIKPITVTALPSPVAVAGPDQLLCFGNSTQLHGSGGTVFQWTPSTYLDDPSSANPRVIRPPAGIHTYHLVVSDATGCSSQQDVQVKITVSVSGKIGLPMDTLIAINQPLQLNAIDINGSGFTSWLWTPSYGLSDVNIPNPIATLDRDMHYRIQGVNPAGCSGEAFIRVRVYNGPEIYVPTAFTPGKADGRNDLLKAIPVGIRQFIYFNIYDRAGQLVFSTSDPQKGWDGKINGSAQGSGVFAWMAKGIDYKGKEIFRKGITTIIR